MSDLNFQQKYEKILLKNNSLLCIGLDPEFEKIPFSLKAKPETAIFEFNKAIINETNHLVCAYKLNSAFYEAQGDIGIKQLKDTCDLLKYSYPDILVLLDFKRGDIGNTNEQYVKFAYDYLGVDAVTLHTYFGKESLLPFLNIANKGCIILCRTSNPGAGEFQDMMVDGQPLYQKIAVKVATEWNDNKNCMLVVGATYPQELAEVRKLVGDKMIFLIPGVGAQAADLGKVISAGKNTTRDGFMINASRSIIHASTDSDFFLKAKAAAEKLKNDINIYRAGEQMEDEKEQEEKDDEGVAQTTEMKQAQTEQQPAANEAAPQQTQTKQKPLTGAQAIIQKIADEQKEQAAVKETKKEDDEKKAFPFGKPFEKAQIADTASNTDKTNKPEGGME